MGRGRGRRAAKPGWHPATWCGGKTILPTIRRLLRSGWGLLAIGIVVGTAVSLLLATWTSTEDAPAPREVIAVATPPSAIAPTAGDPHASTTDDIAVRPPEPVSLPEAGPDQHASTPTESNPAESSPDSVPQTATLPRVTQPSVPTPEPPAWLRNAVATPDIGDRPMIAIVIDDLGLNRGNAKRVIALPGPLTLAFMTYAEDLDRQTRAARAAGHELIVHLPMEPLGDGFDSGPNTLEVDLPPDELLRRLRWGLTRFDGYVGINNHMGSRFTGWDTGMALVLEELRARGLLFLDSRTIGNSVAKQVAQTVGVPYAGRDVFLDNESSAEAVRERLAETETIARRYGFAVAIGHPHNGTIEALSGWLATLAERGYVLVPISAIVRHNLAASG
jgi:uncharacterized protein